MPLKYSSIDAPKAHCTWADSHICFMSATRYAHSIKKRRIIKFTDERGQLIRPLTARGYGALLAVSLCLLGMGCLACRPAGEALYGVQNLSGPSAALSILSGEAARYDAEMTLREEALNDPTQPVVTLSPLTAVPDVFMDDLIVPGAEYDVRPSLAAYYGKEAILIAGEEEAP